MRRLNKHFMALYLISLLITAFGQPDRNPIFSLLSIIIGYAGVFRVLIEIEEGRRRVLAGFIWALGVQLFQLSWVATTHYHGMGIIAVYFFLCILIASQFAFLSWFIQKNSPPLRTSFAIASIWTCMEYSRIFLFCGFPFNPAGLSLSFSEYPLQIASILGIYGLTFYYIFTSSVACYALFQKKKKLLAIWAFLLAFPFLFGVIRLEFHRKDFFASPPVVVGLVQTGLSEEERWSCFGDLSCPISQFEQWERIFNHLKEGGREVFDLIVLPEVALTGDAFEIIAAYEDVQEKFNIGEDIAPPFAEPFATLHQSGKWYVSNAWIAQSLANKYKADLIAGLVTFVKDRNQSHNSAFHFEPFKQNLNRYDKQILVPLTEYLPFNAMRALAAKFGVTSFFLHGNESKVLPGRIPLFTSICFEEGFSHIVRKGRANGAKMLINITNDGWFPQSRLPIEHFNLGRIRAVENGAPLLRACNTGITAAIDAFGRISAALPERDKQGLNIGTVLTGRVQYYYTNTIYTKCGDALILAICCSGILLIPIRWIARKKTR